SSNGGGKKSSLRSLIALDSRSTRRRGPMVRSLFATLVLLLFFVLAGFVRAQEPVKLHASVVAKTFGFGPVWVASKQGFFNQQKLDVEVLLIRVSDVSTQALAGGSLQVPGASSDAPIAAFDR